MLRKMTGPPRERLTPRRRSRYGAHEGAVSVLELARLMVDTAYGAMRTA